VHAFLLLRVPLAAADEVAAQLAERPGFLGIEELPATGEALFPVDPVHQFVRFDATASFAEYLRTEQFRHGDHVLLKVYLADESALPQWLADSTLPIIDHGQIEPQDYMASVREQFHGREVGDRLWVGPPWETPPAGKVAVIIEPGMAFGLGDHPTTQMCLELLTGIDDARRIFDVGTGTGILAIAAARQFPDAELWLSDLDPQCRSNVEHNFALNNLPAPAHQLYGEQPIPAGPFDLVLSNLYLEALKSLAALDTRRWIVSGLLGEEQLAEFKCHITAFTVVRQLQREDWFALELHRPDS